MHCVTMDSYSTQNFDSCMMVSENQQCNMSQSVNNQSQTGQIQTQEDHDKQQQMEQTHQITQQNQLNTENKVLTPIRLPAILDGEYFTVTKVEDSNVTVRCSQCKRHLSGNLKSTGNFLSHIKVNCVKVCLILACKLMLRSSWICSQKASYNSIELYIYIKIFRYIYV